MTSKMQLAYMGIAHSSSTHAQAGSVSTRCQARYSSWLLTHVDVCIFDLIELAVRASPYLISSLSLVGGIIFLWSSRNASKSGDLREWVRVR